MIGRFISGATLGRWGPFVLISAVLVGAATLFAGQIAGDSARADLVRQADAAAVLHAAVLRSELEKHRSLPFVLAQDPDVRQALASGDRARLQALDRKLETLSDQTRAAVIYLLDDQGQTLAASNWRLPTSFVGSNYSFRPYFRDSVKTGSAEHFALGTVSGRPGLFLGRRVDGAGGKALGVVVVKVEFDALEGEWRGSEEPAFVTDPNGIVLVTSVPSWRFRTLAGIPEPERSRLRASLQFGGEALQPLPLKPDARHARERTGRLPGADQDARFVSASVPASSPGWTLHVLTAADRALDARVTAARAVTLMLTSLIVALAAILIYRRQRAVRLAAAQEAARAELESRVIDRTQELSAANQQLVREMDERRRAEVNLHRLQDELIQANKLATLGQIAAGVAHEINQPVAAIRAYADNAQVFLDRDQTGQARENLGVIGSLTARIGLITDELRAFARKTTGQVQPVKVGEAVSGALLLVGARLRQQGIDLVQTGVDGDISVLADRMRLEQVLVNLLQNAAEALGETPGPKIRVEVRKTGGKVRITVADNGPGLAPAALEGLFTPFVTTKPQGLGLGLVISRDIIAEFGGELSAAPSTATQAGAAFVITLRAG
jgi:two-component system, NtrC family, C4-dicarboxylate transport sensor histidine kinase DctB